MRSLLPHLAGGYDVHHFALDYRGPPLEAAWTTHPNVLPGDIHGLLQLPELVSRLRPDVLWIVHDVYLYALLAPALASFRPRTKVLTYSPVDGDRPRAEKLALLHDLDRLVVFTEAARRTVVEGFSGLAAPAPPVEVVPHGLDVDLFHPCSNGDSRRVARAALHPDRPELADAFVVLNANRNSLRKRIDLSLRAFALFCRGKDSVFLHLHMGMQDRGVDVERLVDELGIRDRVLTTAIDRDHPFVSDARLNLVYNACEVGINTATGEGWGLVAFEHAATGAAQVLPAHSACLDLWAESAVLVPAEERFENPFDWLDHRLVRPEDVAAALERLYRDRTLLHEMSARAFERARAPELRWEAIALTWRGIFDEAVS